MRRKGSKIIQPNMSKIPRGSIGINSVSRIIEITYRGRISIIITASIATSVAINCIAASIKPIGVGDSGSAASNTKGEIGSIGIYNLSCGKGIINGASVANKSANAVRGIISGDAASSK